MKAYSKSLSRMFFSNILRVFTLSFIIAIGICIVTGVGSLPLRIRDGIPLIASPQQSAAVSEVADKIEILGLIFPVFFVSVAVLTALTTISRLAEEERSVAACLKTLGFSNAAIVFKYVLFALLCALLGCVIGLIFGEYILSPILFDSIKAKFEVPKISGFYMRQGIIWSFLMTAAVFLTALFAGLEQCRGKPAQLLRPKAPKAGRMIVLEKISFIWKKLKFKYKSSARNIIRYKSRLVMTVLSVAGATALVFCGLGLYTSLNSLKSEVAEMGGIVDSIIPISAAFIICASALAVLVLFNLTNVNIEERRREIATLKVLGYTDMEVAGFIFREVSVMSVLGIIFGLPLGYAFLGFLFVYFDFGSLDHVTWLVWLLSAAVATVSVVLTDFLLYSKISKIQMHTSLKIIE